MQQGTRRCHALCRVTALYTTRRTELANHHAGRRMILPRLVLATALMGLMLASSMTAAFATTVGIISGSVTDAQSHAPLANVRVTAAAATGSYNATTDARGFFSMTGVYADTYTVSF